MFGALKNLSPQRTRRPRRKTNQELRNRGKVFPEIEGKAAKVAAKERGPPPASVAPARRCRIAQLLPQLLDEVGVVFVRADLMSSSTSCKTSSSLPLPMSRFICSSHSSSPPAVQPRRQLGALLKRQLLNGALDFGEAHGPEFPRKKRSRNNRKPGAVSGIRTILAPTSFS
jgi:hypothetical protein